MPSTTSWMPSDRLPLPRRVPGRPRGATGAALGALVLCLSAAACGQDAAPGAGSPSAAATGSPGVPASSPGATASEVRLARVGGVAGFQDALAVAPDGSVSGSTRGGAVDCTVPVATAQVLATAAPPTTGLNAGNDRIATSVERGGTTYDLGEAQGSDPLSTTARELLDDVQQPEGQRTLCR